ncbi:hypothetical protein ACH4E7_33670 [Kitasatospora sp. NPDC018058]
MPRLPKIHVGGRGQRRIAPPLDRTPRTARVEPETTAPDGGELCC